MISESRPLDEISLADLWEIVRKGKWWVLGCLFASVVVATAYLALAMPVYEATARIRVGQVAGGGLFEVPEVVASRLLARYGESPATGVKRPLPYLKSATVPKGLTSVVQLVSEGDTPEQAVGLLSDALVYIRESHELIYSQGLKSLDERLANLDSQRVVLVGQINEAQTLVERLKQKNPVQASLVLIESGRLATTVTTLDAERPAIVQQRMAPLTQTTALLGDIEMPVKPAQPKKALVLAMAFIGGLMGGLLLALLTNTRRGLAS
jgi:LPS O-antigen subunit length determinant protein (WzzB/FepE family)